MSQSNETRIPLQPPGFQKSTYEYSPLPSTPTSFRFAYLLPGSYDEDLHVELHTLVLDLEGVAKLTFEALSWVWGRFGDLREIFVDECTFHVTRNLFVALKHLRHETEERVIWVDALCINQDDLSERNQQIPQMALIFHRAQRVIAWLGEGDAGSNIVMKLARDLHNFEAGNLKGCDENVMWILALTFGIPQIKANLSNSLFQYWNIHKYENWSFIDQMADRELFRRIWVLQECALAKDLRVQCGLEYISWDALFRAVSLRIAQDDRSRINAGWTAMQAIENLRGLVLTKKRPPDLLELLWASRNYRSTDARDRIFALLGVSNVLYGTEPGHQIGFEIDYQKSVVEIYRSFTISRIVMQLNLQVLATKRSNRTHDDQSLGSWCPDWAHLDDGVSLLYRKQQWSGTMIDYNACRLDKPRLGEHVLSRIFPSSIMSSVKSGRLTLGGFKLDTIAAVRHSTYFASDDARLYDWHHWALWPAERVWTEHPLPRAQPDPRRQDAFWRTVIADADANGNRHPKYLHAQFQLWHQKVFASLAEGNEVSYDASAREGFKDFFVRMRHVTKGRCLFETADLGLLGIGDEDFSAELGGPQLQAGDIVAILSGGPLPVILRRVPQRGRHGTPQYKLVGDAFCYVHGVVDGEAMSLEQAKERQQFVIV